MINTLPYPGLESVTRIRHRVDGDKRNAGFGTQNTRQPSPHRGPNQKVWVHLHQFVQAIFNDVFRNLSVIDVVTIDRAKLRERFKFVAGDIEAAGEAVEVVYFQHFLRSGRDIFSDLSTVAG